MSLHWVCGSNCTPLRVSGLSACAVGVSAAASAIVDVAVIANDFCSLFIVFLNLVKINDNITNR